MWTFLVKKKNTKINHSLDCKKKHQSSLTTEVSSIQRPFSHSKRIWCDHSITEGLVCLTLEFKSVLGLKWNIKVKVSNVAELCLATGLSLVKPQLCHYAHCMAASFLSVCPRASVTAMLLSTISVLMWWLTEDSVSRFRVIGLDKAFNVCFTWPANLPLNSHILYPLYRQFPPSINLIVKPYTTILV